MQEWERTFVIIPAPSRYGAQRRVFCMIVSRKKEERWVTCDEPNAQWPKWSTGWVIYNRNGLCHCNLKILRWIKGKLRQTSLVVGERRLALRKHCWLHNDERHIWRLMRHEGEMQNNGCDSWRAAGHCYWNYICDDAKIIEEVSAGKLRACDITGYWAPRWRTAKKKRISALVYSWELRDLTRSAKVL